MPRPTTPLGGTAPWVHNPDGTDAPGQTTFDTDPASLPPLTRALRETWGLHTPYPVASAPAMAALLAAVHDLETRVTALE